MRFMPMVCWPLCVLLLAHASPAAALNLNALRSSIFKIQVIADEPSLTEPWKRLPSAHSSGTGFYIGEGRILTNAHVVANASFVTVLRDGDAAPIAARVRFIAHDCDLAVLEAVDPEGIKAVLKLEPMSFGSLPKLRSPVSTIGFPAGGEQLSITEGIVSRISYHRYIHHANARHLLVQVDSAINPGNSGGPVVQGRQVIGVAFQSISQAQSTGYIIPTPVVRRFLRDIANGRYEGHPDDGLTTMDGALLNPSTAAFYGLSSDSGGVTVAFVSAWAPTATLIRPGDILLAIDDQPIGVDGKVSYSGERVDFRTLFDLKLMGDKVVFQVLRDGQNLKVEVPVKPSLPHHATDHIYAKHPRYFVYAGLVFTVLSRNFLQTWGDRWYRDAPLLLRYLESDAVYLPDFAANRDIIVLAKRLPDGVNAYVPNQLFGVVRAVDGKPILSMEALVSALSTGTGEFASIQFFGNQDPIVLDRAKVLSRNAIINAKYGVVPDRWLNGASDDGALHGMEGEGNP